MNAKTLPHNLQSSDILLTKRGYKTKRAIHHNNIAITYSLKKK